MQKLKVTLIQSLNQTKMRELFIGAMALVLVVVIAELETERFYPFGVFCGIFALVTLILGCVKLISEAERHE